MSGVVIISSLGSVVELDGQVDSRDNSADAGCLLNCIPIPTPKGLYKKCNSPLHHLPDIVAVCVDTTHIELYSGVIMDLTGEDEWSDWEDEETPAQSLLEDRMLPSAKARWSFG